MGKEILYGQGTWEEINDLAMRAYKENWFPEAAEKGALAYIKSCLRRMAKKRDPITKLPILASIEIADSASPTATKRVYKQLSLFDIADYEQVCGYHYQQAEHHRSMATAYSDDCYKKYGIRLIYEQINFGFEMENSFGEKEQKHISR